MTNHYHVVVETPEANLSKGMRQLNGVYTQHVNRRHGLAGHLFQGRFKAIVVERDPYLLELARYVVLNPVRAGLVPEVSAWAWSSYPAMVGLAPTPPWLETDWVLGQFADNRHQAQARYAAFVAEGLGQPPLWDGLRHQVFLGSEQFVNRLARLARNAGPLKRLREVPRLFRAGLSGSPRSHGARLSDRRVHHAGDRRVFRGALLDGQPYSALGRSGGRADIPDAAVSTVGACLIVRPAPWFAPGP
jgi:hypothetical protein